MSYIKNVYINQLDEIIEQYSTNYRTIKMKPADVKPGMYIEYGTVHDNKYP